MLTLLDHIPDGLLDCTAQELHRILPGPTLIQLPGRRPRPLFVSVLLHGNETTGLSAIQSLFNKYQQRELPRELCIFIGNVSAAQYNQRHLHGQPDYNRVWPCGGLTDDCTDDTPEHRMMREIVDLLRERNVFASIDIHNNTGRNPHYGCINQLNARFFHLATQFSHTVVYFIRPKGVQSMAFSSICPAVTVECGQPGQPHGTAHATNFIHSCLQLSDLPSHPVAAHDMDLFHTVATVSVPEHINIRFDGSNNGKTRINEIRFLPGLDQLNFHELAAGITLGFVDPRQTSIPLHVIDELGNDATRRFLRVHNGELQTACEVLPSMFTLNAEVIRQDCLGYLMERMKW